ncbi:MAG: glycosyltransferase family 2 protein [Anaerolineae bacterium]|nr:glycosyltransferase family 2 protein [Anaerolineae bacterium]
MQLSIALCTYNGVNYLPEQLESIASQTRLPDELVICDDASADDTLTLAEDFARRVSFPVKIHRHDSNIGSTRNFDYAIQLCSGDVIALADQDDVWLPEKLAQIEAAFEAHPEVGIVFSDALIVDANLTSMGLCMSDTVYKVPDTRDRLATSEAFRLLLRRNYITGATMAFRAQYRPLISPISPHWVHDYWISLLVATQASILPLTEPLILYRQHASNQIGLRNRLPFLRRAQKATAIPTQAYQQAYQKFEDLRQRLAEQLISLAPEDEQFLNEKTAHNYARAMLPASGLPRLRAIAAEVRNGHYQRYAPNGVWSALRDILA